MLRSIRFMLLLALALLAALVAAPAASAATTCSKETAGLKSRGFGPAYVTKLKVTNTTCKLGVEVVKAFHACRRRNGGADGRCSSKVKRYTCTEKRPAADKGPVSYDGDVICKNGTKRVTHHYQQNTD